MTHLDPENVRRNLDRVLNGDADAYFALANDIEQMLNLLTSAANRLRAVAFLADFYADNGEVPVSELQDALEGEMVIG